MTIVDQTAVRSGQALTAIVLMLAFVIDLWTLAAAVGVANLLGAVQPSWSLPAAIYERVLRPLRLVRPRLIPDDPAPHRFAQGFSGVTTLASAALVAVGVPVGWLLAWLVVVLAGLNVFVGFCAGCFTFRQLQRVGLLGHTRSAVTPEAVR